MGTPERFQSTRPMRGATALSTTQDTLFLFQSTRPMRGATGLIFHLGRPLPISIHAPHAGRDTGTITYLGSTMMISIHAPHAGRDAEYWYQYITGHISIHAPHAGRDAMLLLQLPDIITFQSTRPMRGATI